MKELLEYIAKSLVDYPDDVSVTEIEGDTVIKAAAGKDRRRVVVEIVQ